MTVLLSRCQVVIYKPVPCLAAQVAKCYAADICAVAVGVDDAAVAVEDVARIATYLLPVVQCDVSARVRLRNVVISHVKNFYGVVLHNL